MSSLNLTKQSWSEPFKICSFDEDWEQSEKTPGVYIIRKAGSIQRVGGVDKTGILYFGKAIKLRSRVYGFLKKHHQASYFLYESPAIARLVLNGKIKDHTDVKEHLKKLTVRFATPLRADQLNRAERALFFSYIKLFGEAPPLNLSIPSRWEVEPSSQDLHWAEEGIKRRA